jgi:hypothetical protein
MTKLYQNYEMEFSFRLNFEELQCGYTGNEDKCVRELRSHSLQNLNDKLSKTSHDTTTGKIKLQKVETHSFLISAR